MKPKNTLEIASIDGKASNTFADNLKILPGTHRITVLCRLNGRVLGEKTFEFNATSGKINNIFYPENINMHGYMVDFTACQHVVLR